MRLTTKAVLGAWLSAAGVSAATAQTLTLDQICPADAAGVHRFSPASVMTATLDATQPSRRALDVNGDGTETEAERIQTIVQNPCSSGSRCAADNQKIVDAQLLLASVFERSDVTIGRLRPPPSPGERQREPWLDAEPADGAVGSIPELLDPSGRFLAVTCKSVQTAGTPNGAPAPTGDPTPPARPQEKPALRVTSKLEELSRKPAQDIKTIDPATLSIANDSVGDKLTFAIDGIVGVNIPIGENNSLIPFVQYQRTSVRDRSTTPATTSRSPDKLGIGAVISVEAGRYDQVDVAPVYIVDYEKGSRTATAKVNWIPGFLRDIPGIPVVRSLPVARGLLYWGVTPRVLVQGSHVFDAGTNTELMTTSNYLRAGGDVSLDLWGAGALSNLTGSLSYKRLFRLTSGPRDVDLLKANLQYWLDDGQRVSIGYTYERGLDEDTADRVEDWKLSLGVRF